MGWAGLSNGVLLRRASEDFDVFVTIDRNLTFQQNLSELRIAVVVLVGTGIEFDALKPLMPDVLERLPSLRPGQIMRIGPTRA